jgi:hypothetical protein
MSDPENAGRDQAGRFAKGRSGNVAGKPKGARNRASLLLDKMAQAEAAAVLRAVIDKAKCGDMMAAATILARLWPVQKSRSIKLNLPPIATAADVTAALDVISAAIGCGQITPEEGSAIAGIVEQNRKAIETQQLEQRIASLEVRNANA